MRGFLHGTAHIFRTRGVAGFFQGFIPTTARQSANSATRFSAYTTLKQFVAESSYVAPGEKLGTLSTFALGGVAGLITVYVTQPLDTIKTRMQSIEARKEYRNSFVCVERIFREEGIRVFWSGAVPRLARLVLSGGIVFTMYVSRICLFYPPFVKLFLFLFLWLVLIFSFFFGAPTFSLLRFGYPSSMIFLKERRGKKAESLHFSFSVYHSICVLRPHPKKDR